MQPSRLKGNLRAEFGLPTDGKTVSFVDEFGAEWASIDDAKQARVDALLYGTQFVKRDENGRLCRIDPTTVTFVENHPVAE